MSEKEEKSQDKGVFNLPPSYKIELTWKEKFIIQDMIITRLIDLKQDLSSFEPTETIVYQDLQEKIALLERLFLKMK